MLTVIMQVTLPNGLQAVGSGATKKLAKHDAARAMLDIMDGRAAAVTEKVSVGWCVCCLSVVTLIMVQVSQSITDGLKALRGDKDSGPGRSHDDRDPDKHGRWTWSNLSVCLIYKIVVNIIYGLRSVEMKGPSNIAGIYTHFSIILIYLQV